jgi:hypothetical protein
MRIKGTAGLLFGFTLWGALTAASALAAETAPSVARISVIDTGSVVVTRAGDTTQVTGTINAPLMPGDFVATTDAETRAEIQLDGFTALRLGSDVQARIVSNDAKARQIQLASGLVELAVLHGGDLTTEIVTPSVTLSTHYAGNYRIEVASDGTTTITARSGQADIVTPQKTTTILAGKTLVARGQAADPAVTTESAIAADSFDSFNTQRDRTLYAALNGDSYVPSSIAGYDDLDQYGRWSDVPSYGEAWIPNQTASWAPYRNGQWTWQGGYGWTWVGNEPWGWVPYHYGSWFYANGYGWCWYPPATGIAPLWAPALVGFFGYGSGPFGYQSLGWVPLGPFEQYYPWFPYYAYNANYPWTGWPPGHRRYYPPPAPPPTRRHRHHDPVVMHPLATAYRNARYGGASSVGAGDWRNGNFAHPVAVDPRHAASVGVLRGSLPVEPTAANRRFSSVALKRTVPLSAAFAQPRFAMALPMHGRPTLPGHASGNSWQRFNRSRGTTIVAPVMHAPAPGSTRIHVPLPVIHVPTSVIHAPPAIHDAAPVVHDAPVHSPAGGSRGGSTHGSPHPPSDR